MDTLWERKVTHLTKIWLLGEFLVKEDDRQRQWSPILQTEPTIHISTRTGCHGTRSLLCDKPSSRNFWFDLTWINFDQMSFLSPLITHYHTTTMTMSVKRTWKTVTSDQWSVSKFLRLHVHRLDSISLHVQMCWSSTCRQNLPPNKCIPSTLHHNIRNTRLKVCKWKIRMYTDNCVRRAGKNAPIRVCASAAKTRIR